MNQPATGRISVAVGAWSLVRPDAIDISFLERQHRRRLSATVQLALTAYRNCNPEFLALRTVFASRYGELSRTLGILEDIVGGNATSPAAFSVSVHNTPAGIVGISTRNTAPSGTVAANAATVEAAFLEAGLQMTESAEDIVLVCVDEPLPDGYERFRAPADEPMAFAIRLTARADRRLTLSWRARPDGAASEPAGMPPTPVILNRLLESGSDVWKWTSGRLEWEWTVDRS